MDHWDVNAIVLHHRTRFFSAALLAVQQLDASDGSKLSLLGNLSWAGSSFFAKDREQQVAMAFGGALLGALGPGTVAGGAGVAEQLGVLERAFLDRHDEIVANAWASLSQSGLLDASPSAVNEHVWALLFPPLAYRQSLGELVLQLREVLSE